MTLRPYTAILHACTAPWEKRYYNSDCRILHIFRKTEYGESFTNVTIEGLGANLEFQAAEDIEYFTNIGQPYVELTRDKEKIKMYYNAAARAANSY